MSILPCDRCGQCGCECGALPYTITATFSDLKNKTHSEHCALTITSDFGSGAAAVALSPGGDSKGPMTAALVTEGGCGYATLGHVEPTLEISGGSGTGATFTPTLEVIDTSQNPSCYVWRLKSVDMDGGIGYELGEYLTIKATDNAVERASASAKIAFGRKEPELTASADGGSGADLKVNLAASTGVPKTWSVDSVSVKDGGTGYKEGAAVTFSYGPDDTQVTAAEATISTKHEMPTLSASVFSYSGGTGATFGPPVLVTDDNKVWRVQSVPVISAGSGYIRGEAIQIAVVDGEETRAAFVAVRETTDPSGFGGIVRVEPYSDYGGGEYFKDTGIIDSVSVTNPGEYYGETGTPGSVDVVAGGAYYLESKTAAPCVAKVAISHGCAYGGEQPLIAIIDTNTESDTFGEITGVGIGGAGKYNELFQAWTWAMTANESLNGEPIVLVANSPKKLVTVSLESCFGSGAKVAVNAVGERAEPTIHLSAGGGSNCPNGSPQITAALSNNTDDSGRKYWSVDSVTASGGYGFPDSGTAASVASLNPCLAGQLPVITLTADNGELTGAVVEDPGAFWNQLKYDGLPGPLREVSVCDGGGGYAMLGREQPSLKIEPADGSLGKNATFTPSFANKQDDCEIDYWEIESVSVSGGECFGVPGRVAPLFSASLSSATGDGATLKVTAVASKDDCGGDYWTVESIAVSGGYDFTSDDTVKIAATAPEQGQHLVVRHKAEAKVQVKHEQPTLRAFVDVRRFSVTYDSGDPWAVTKLDPIPAPPPPRFGFVNNTPIRFALGLGDVEDKAASAVVKTVLAEPTILLSASDGENALLEPTLSKQSDGITGDDYWEVSSVKVINAGSGYSTASTVAAKATNGQEAIGSVFSAKVSSVDDNGGIVGVSIASGGKFFRDTFEYASTKISNGGKYYKKGVPSIEITDPGEYFVKGPDESLKISLETENDKQDMSASLTVQTNDDGEPTGVTVVERGKFYRENKSLSPYVADVTIKLVQLAPSNGSGAELSAVIDDDTESETFGVIKAIKIEQPGSNYEILGAPYDCTYTASGCKDDYNYSASLQFRGRGKTPRISLSPGAVFDGASPLEDCNSIPASASLLYGADSGSVQLAKGGAVVTDCEPQGYCVGGGPCAFGNFFPCATKVSWTLTATIPDEKDAWGQSIFPQPGAFSFSKNIVPPEPPPPPPVDPSVRGDWYPGNTWFIPFDYNVNFPIGYFGWPPSNPSGYYRPGIGADVYPVCVDEKAYLWAFLGAQGAQWCVYVPNAPPFVGFGLDDETLRQKGALPIEWVNGIPRVQAGTHSFSHSTGCGSGQITLNYSLTVEYT